MYPCITTSSSANDFKDNSKLGECSTFSNLKCMRTKPCQSRRTNTQMPDKYLLPNKILFLQTLPESVTKNTLFSQCVPDFIAVYRQVLTDGADIPIYTKFGLFPQREILHSWGTLMRKVRQWQTMLCIITSGMGRTRTRSVFISFS